ncbi:M23 family metallopeptidase [Maricaulis sp.]|uniref:M23 family metallopeptidase n=1 Tax=Maricaulis sp. TaxID=1486257 RepID=UPI0026369FBC|nr:M23 family metallopeptidase [Maricaulis sp.]
MRLSVLIGVFAVVSTVLAGCASTPREPARVDYRSVENTSRSGIARPINRDCRNGYTVRSGDTLSEVAERCGVPLRELASANGLNAPYTLRVGQSLSMPRPPVHVVQRGENLYRIGLRYNIPFQTLASHNGIRAPYAIEVGQQIQLPRGTQVASTSTRSTSGPSRPRATSRRDARVERSEPAANAPRFDWPVRGRVISGFGRTESGGRNDGINIEVSAGTEVRASAAGQVVYAGSELAGYGQLILLRHSNGYVTAYAHNRRLLVREGDQVERGQVVAEAGSSGTVDSPQVHFEIRRGVNPEDPMRHLR